jgi:hypothetical protein
LLRAWADELGIADPDDFAREWQTLMSGSIIQAVQGDREAARSAKDAARVLLASRRGS